MIRSFLALLCGLAFAIPLTADVLVLQDGTEIETRGAWEERGAQILFRNAEGVLVSISTEEVDLEASGRRTAEEKKAAATNGAETAKAEGTPGMGAAKRRAGDSAPVAVLTDGDVAKAEARAGSEEPKVTVYVTSWCGYCRKTLALLRELGVPYLALDVERNPAASLEHRRLTGGRGGVPVTVIGDRVVGGFNERLLRELLTPKPAPEEEPPAEGADTGDRR